MRWAKVQRACEGAVAARGEGAKVRCEGAKVRRCEGSKVRRCAVCEYRGPMTNEIGSPGSK